MKSKLIPKIIRPFSEDFRRIPGKHEFSVLLLLTALGFCGNYFNLELFFGVNFVFGSIAVLLAVRMSGMLWGGLAGLAVGAYTWVLWLHPYAMIVFGLEAFWVGYFQGFFQDRFRQKEKENLILTVLWFWILMGMWLTAFLYRHMLGMPPVQVELIALKQTVNSLFNAAIARIIIQMIPKGRLSRIFFRKIPSGRWSLESAMKLILAVFVLLPLLTAMVVTNRNKPAEIRSAMGRKAGGIAEDAKSRVCSRMQIYAEMLASVVSAELQLYPSRYCILPLMDHSGDKYIPGLENLEIVKKDGTVIYDYLYRGYDASEYPRLISLAEKGGVAFSDIRHGVSIKEKYFSLAVPLSRKDLFLIASLSPDIFKNEFCRKHYGRMFIKIQDSRGNPVTGNSEEPLPPDLIPGKHPDILFHKNNTSAMTRWSDAFWQTRKSVSAQNQWAVTVLLPLGDSIIAMQNDYVRQLIIIFSVAVTALLLSSHTASLLGRSIVELTEVVGKLSESTSRSDVSWPDSSVSEIFFLIRQFRILLDEVNRRQEELRWITADLELRVQERTEDLQKALIETEKAREWIDGILKSVGEGIIVTDLQNCVTLMNPAAEKWLTCRPGSLLGTCREFDIVEETLRDNIRNAIEKGIITYEFDFESRTEEDDVRFVMQGCTSVIYDKSGIARGTVTAFHDVTREREADRIKTEFLSTAAHELRTPLTSILGFSELLLTRQNLTEGEKSEFLTYINRQAANLGNLINDLLELSRIESGKGFVMQFGPHIMEDLIRDVVSYYKGIFLQHEFITELGEKSIYVDIDRDKICQVLHNLLSNSIKFSPGGGTIRIRAGIAGSNYSVCVRDEGIGMTADQMEKMFDKFYRADAGDSAPEGTGLGMSIVKHIIRAHKGEIQVSSDYGQGTTVCFFIPIRKYQ